MKPLYCCCALNIFLLLFSPIEIRTLALYSVDGGTEVTEERRSQRNGGRTGTEVTQERRSHRNGGHTGTEVTQEGRSYRNGGHTEKGEKPLEEALHLLKMLLREGVHNM